MKVAYIGGGSLNWARVFMNDMAREERLSGHVNLYDIDFEAAELNERIGARYAALPEVKGRWTYTAAPSLPDALTGVDLVVISILPGDFDDMASDVHTPEKYGIFQSVGDTTGPGGMVRALRAIPMFEGFAEAIRDYCPEAWVINFTNPMSTLVRTLYRVFPEIRAWGCCHEIFSTQKLLAEMASVEWGREVADFHDVRVNVLGINHFTWIDRASWRGRDLLPLWDRMANAHYATGWPKDGRKIDDARSNCFDCLNRVKFDLWRHFGVIAAAGDRHLVEFMPQAWYLRDHGSWGFGMTPVSYRVKERADLREKARRIARGEEDIVLFDSGEAFAEQIVALCGLGDLITNVNLPNRGQLQGLPEGAVVESNALFTAEGVQPLAAGRLPWDVEYRVRTHIVNQDSLVDAALQRDLEKAFRTFMNDPALAAVGPADGRRLFDEMIENIADRLPAGLRGAGRKVGNLYQSARFATVAGPR